MGNARSRLGVVGAATLLVASVLPASLASAREAGPAGPSAGAQHASAPAPRAGRAPRSAACTVRGSSRSERLVGTPGRDVICGGGGADVLVGRGGDDVLRGGAGRDAIRGGGGDDLLDGGPAGDALDGGPGPDTCLIDVSDRPESCDYDRTGPEISAVTVSRTAVDVTDGPQTVVVTVRATDDTGVTTVAVRPGDTPWFPAAYAERVSGSARDGLWSARVTFPRYVPGGTYRPHVQAYDELGRDTRREPQEQVVVTDATPDTERPQAELLSPDPDRVFDTRTGTAVVPVRVRLTDPLSGVDPEQVTVGLWEPRILDRPASILGGRLELEDGDLHDGIWAGTIALPTRSKTGAWSVGLFAGDLAGRGSPTRVAYWGPGERQYQSESRFEHRSFPEDRGTVSVVGRDLDDVTGPEVSDVEVTPTRIDTRLRPATVRVSLRATDTGRGVKFVAPTLSSEDPALDLDLGRSMERVSGTATDGRYVLDIPVPRGTPPGRYHFSIYVEDRDDNPTRYVDDDDPTVRFAAIALDLPDVEIEDTTPR